MIKTAERLFRVPNHGKLWKSLMRVHLANYEELEKQLHARPDCAITP